jgi:hypothetical protein
MNKFSKDTPKLKGNKKQKSKECEDSEREDEEDKKDGGYFWPVHLHQEFLKQFSIYGKTWKVVSQKMFEKGYKCKDQLKCRTHG